MRALVLLLLSLTVGMALTLEQAVEIALKNHLSAKLSLLELKKAEESIRRARAGILPQLSFFYGYTRLSEELAFGFTPKNRHSFNLELEQAVFDRAVLESLKLAREQKELQELVRRDTLLEVEFQTKQLFYALLYKREVLNLLQENLRYWEENLRRTEGRFQAGTAPKVELLRARAQVETAKAQVESARADYQKSLQDFGVFLQIDGVPELQGRLTYQPPPKVEETLLEKNSTLRVVRKGLEVAKRAVEVQRAQHYPSLDVFLSYQGNTARVGGKTEMVDGYAFGARLSYKVFDGFAREASVAQARLEVLKQAEQLKDSERRVKAEFQKTLEDIRSLQVQIGALELSLQSAKEALRLSTERYRFGVATQLEVLEAVSNYNSLLQSYYFALLQYQIALARLERLTR
ncbi:MAG: TolC family protein [Aquificaceae bacterium]|nr:TolC family protein [Aquificaceae bacterium]MDW8097048.1 TolC family protein [Aquificaceae bacterium]